MASKIKELTFIFILALVTFTLGAYMLERQLTEIARTDGV